MFYYPKAIAISMAFDSALVTIVPKVPLLILVATVDIFAMLEPEVIVAIFGEAVATVDMLLVGVTCPATVARLPVTVVVPKTVK
tara:strand:- start:25 stop:276 length:252 start_codon:yes stop_codon:yes gene_type:complete